MTDLLTLSAPKDSVEITHTSQGKVTSLKDGIGETVGSASGGKDAIASKTERLMVFGDYPYFGSDVKWPEVIQKAADWKRAVNYPVIMQSLQSRLKTPNLGDFVTVVRGRKNGVSGVDTNPNMDDGWV